MPSKAETVLLALHTALTGTGLAVERNNPVPEDADAGTVVILHDGEPGQPDVTLSPLAYHYEHLAELDVIVFGNGRDLVFDQVRAAVAAALAADRSLGGTCDWVEARAPQPTDLYTKGGWPAKAATIPIALVYATADPLT